MAIRQVQKLKDVANQRLRMSSVKSFKFSDLEVTLGGPEQLQPKPDVGQLEFGKFFTDHMFKVEFENREKGWKKPKIMPMENISLHPAAKVLHYAVEIFEGMKAYRGVDDKIRLFRPNMNMIRMIRAAKRSGLPTFDTDEMIKILCRLIQIDQEWVPHAKNASLYIRPTFIGTDPFLGVISSEAALLYVICSPTKGYFSETFKSMSLLADPRYTRAWPGGCGDNKMGCNYGPTVQVQREAVDLGLQSVLWLFGEEEQITEAGTMNIFLAVKGENGEKELITPPLNGLILPGVLRNSVLELARENKRTKVTERTITMKELINLVEKGRCLEMFGVGTACIVSPISSILYKDRLLEIPTMEQNDKEYEFYDKILTRIQYGQLEHPWGVCIDDYDKNET